jgi:hypothetical protein
LVAGIKDVPPVAGADAGANDWLMDSESKIAVLQNEVSNLKARATELEKQIAEYSGLVNIYHASSVKVNTKLDQIYSALTGDTLGNAGVIKRLDRIEEVVSWINTKKSALIGALAGVGMVTAGAYWVIQQIADWLK